MGRPKLYSDAERCERKRAQNAAWRAKNKERIAGYYEANKEAYKAKAAEWRRRNPDRAKELDTVRRTQSEYKEQRKAYRERNREKVQSGIAAWRRANKDRHLAHAKEWRAANPERARAADLHKNTVRQRLIGGQGLAKYYATEIRAFYRSCPPGHHVDHIIPLRGKTVCGLHVPINLQYLPSGENMQKGNRFDPVAEEQHLLATLQGVLKKQPDGSYAP